MHETKTIALRAVTPDISEGEDRMVGSTQSLHVQNGVSFDLNIPKIGMDNLDKEITSPNIGVSSQSPKNPDKQSLPLPDWLYLRTPGQESSQDDSGMEEASGTHLHRDGLLNQLPQSVAESSERWLTPLPLPAVVTGSVMSPVERMSYIRTVVDDIDDDFMSSSYNISNDSINRSSSFSNSRSRTLSMTRRGLRRNLSGGNRAEASRGGMLGDISATGPRAAGPAGTDLMEHLMSLASGDALLKICTTGLELRNPPDRSLITRLLAADRPFRAAIPSVGALLSRRQRSYCTDVPCPPDFIGCFLLLFFFCPKKVDYPFLPA
ncbi:hypothetical protein EGW08_011206 [Elysia chlorotica]|uniref:Uncharacterized protein n=1 Tax=Elysia chlorotica TaxID=188477 RepID=A0A3S0ZKK3_ELYCH|nr:hypothetical protein EGW08_011206 [Elysia chlorotica]